MKMKTRQIYFLYIFKHDTKNRNQKKPLIKIQIIIRGFLLIIWDLYQKNDIKYKSIQISERDKIIKTYLKYIIYQIQLQKCPFSNRRFSILIITIKYMNFENIIFTFSNFIVNLHIHVIRQKSKSLLSKQDEIIKPLLISFVCDC